jgi:hypothetical protein
LRKRAARRVGDLVIALVFNDAIASSPSDHSNDFLDGAIGMALPDNGKKYNRKKDPKQLTHLASQSSESFDSTFTVQKNTIDPRTTSRATALTIASSYETTPFARFVDATLRINFGFPATDRLDFFLRCVRGAQQ